ncbi:MAG TPA: hypothetical protein VFD59_20935 [Nocardioidaceae bacterium]|nr:hypothetical protein [Nocardioidaceae bacterium]
MSNINSPSWTVDILASTPERAGLAIEYDGAYWHAGDDKTAVDVAKSHDFLAAGYLVVRLREHPLPAAADHGRPLPRGRCPLDGAETRPRHR